MLSQQKEEVGKNEKSEQWKIQAHEAKAHLSSLPDTLEKGKDNIMKHYGTIS